MKKLAAITGGMGSGFVSPAVFRDVENAIYKMGNIKHTNPETLWGRITQYIPWAGRKYARIGLLASRIDQNWYAQNARWVLYSLEVCSQW